MGEIKRYELMQADTIQKGTKPVVSVIVPVYNASYTLDQALTSIRTQSLSNIEIICVEDGSSDESPDMIKSCSDSRITKVFHDANYGYGAAMNDGLEVASGKWIAIVEPDDYILPKMLETLVSAANAWEEEQTPIDIVKSPYYRLVRPEGVKRGDAPETKRECSYRHRVHTDGFFDMKDPKAAHLLRHHPSIWSAIYSKNFLEQHHIRFVEHPGSGWADNEFFYKTLLLAKRIVYVDQAFYCYREETDNEFKQFVLRNPHLPFERWHAMQDLIERYDATDSVKRSHISRGFTYLDGASDALGADDPVVASERERMFARMDPLLVAAEPQLRPSTKRMFFDYTGADWDEKRSQVQYAVGLVKETGYTMRNNGVGFTAHQIKHYLEMLGNHGK